MAIDVFDQVLPTARVGVGAVHEDSTDRIRAIRALSVSSVC